MSKLLLIGCAALLTWLSAGCLFEPYRPNHEFDLTVEKTRNRPKAPVSILEFRNDSSAGLRMQQRLATGQVVRDPYSRWVLDPGELIARALNRALTRPGEANPVRIRGSVELFEVDLAAKSFRFSGSFASASAGPAPVRRFEFTATVRDESAEAIAEAASATVRQLAETIAEADFGVRP